MGGCADGPGKSQISDGWVRLPSTESWSLAERSRGQPHRLCQHIIALVKMPTVQFYEAARAGKGSAMVVTTGPGQTFWGGLTTTLALLVAAVLSGPARAAPPDKSGPKAPA